MNSRPSLTRALLCRLGQARARPYTDHAQPWLLDTRPLGRTLLDPTYAATNNRGATS